MVISGPSVGAGSASQAAAGNMRPGEVGNQLCRGQQRGVTNRTCFACGDFRHFRKDCPTRPSSPSLGVSVKETKEGRIIKDKYPVIFDCSEGSLNTSSDESADSDKIFTDDYYEYEQGQADILVRGRLKENTRFWKIIGSSEFVLDVFDNGYKIPFYSEPTKKEMKNNVSALKNSEFVENALLD